MERIQTQLDSLTWRSRRSVCLMVSWMWRRLHADVEVIMKMTQTESHVWWCFIKEVHFVLKVQRLTLLFFCSSVSLLSDNWVFEIWWWWRSPSHYLKLIHTNRTMSEFLHQQVVLFSLSALILPELQFLPRCEAAPQGSVWRADRWTDGETLGAARLQQRPAEHRTQSSGETSRITDAFRDVCRFM